MTIKVRVTREYDLDLEAWADEYDLGRVVPAHDDIPVLHAIEYYLGDRTASDADFPDFAEQVLAGAAGDPRYRPPGPRRACPGQGREERRMTILATVTTLRCRVRHCVARVSGWPETSNRRADRSAHRRADEAGWAQDARGWLCPDHQYDGGK